MVLKNPQKRTKNPTYWGFIIDKGLFPGRSVHSINAQWQRFCIYENKEEAIRQALKLSSPYCVSFKQIPNYPDSIREVRSFLTQSRRGFKSQMQQLQTTLMKGELDPKLLRKIHKKTSKAVTIQSHSFEP